MRSHPRIIDALLAILLTALASLAATNSPSVEAIVELDRPAKKIPFKDVVLATTRHRVLSFDTNNSTHREMLQKITTAASSALTNARAAGLFSARAQGRWPECACSRHDC